MSDWGSHVLGNVTSRVEIRGPKPSVDLDGRFWSCVLF
jgi:hypothetical protein